MFYAVRLGVTLLPMLFLVGCSEPIDPAKKAEADRLRAEVDELSSTYSSLLEEKQRLMTQNREDEVLIRNLDHNFRNELETRAEAQKIRDYVKALEGADSQVRQSLDAWRKATRESFVGRKIADLTLLSGTHYADVVIVEVTDDFLMVEAQDSTRIEIPFTDISEQVRNALVYEPSILARDSASLIAQ